MWYWINHDKQRYYQADLVQDLFGDWTVVRAWGGLNSQRGNMEILYAPSEAEGIKKIEALVLEREKRGYSLMHSSTCRDGSQP